MPWALFEPDLLIIGECPFCKNDNYELANKFSVNKVDSDGNTLLLCAKRVEDFAFFNQQCTC